MITTWWKNKLVELKRNSIELHVNVSNLKNRIALCTRVLHVQIWACVTRFWLLLSLFCTFKSISLFILLFINIVFLCCVVDLLLLLFYYLFLPCYWDIYIALVKILVMRCTVCDSQMYYYISVSLTLYLFYYIFNIVIYLNYRFYCVFFISY